MVSKFGGFEVASDLVLRSEYMHRSQGFIHAAGFDPFTCVLVAQFIQQLC